MILKSKTAVVTGSTSGIGLAIARAMAKEGANVLINGFGKSEDIERERAAIESEFGVKAIHLRWPTPTQARRDRRDDRRSPRPPSTARWTCW